MRRGDHRGLWVGWLWGLWLVVGTLATGAYYLLPTDLARVVAYDAIGLISSALILVAVRLHRPARPGAWYLSAAGQIVWVAGDVTYGYYEYALDREPYPSITDAFYLSAYPLLAVGFYRLVRGRTARDLAGLVDASVVGTGAGLVFWVFVIVPIAGGEAAGAVEESGPVARNVERPAGKTAGERVERDRVEADGRVVGRPMTRVLGVCRPRE